MTTKMRAVERLAALTAAHQDDTVQPDWPTSDEIGPQDSDTSSSFMYFIRAAILHKSGTFVPTG